MNDTGGWRKLERPGKAISFDLAEFLSTPFGKLARTHALGAFGDGLITVALAGSIFFSVSPEAARWRVALYLLLTIAPFAVVTPLIGPALDRVRGGRRMMVIAASASRMVLAVLMVSHIDSFLLFPEAFGMLVMQKSYSIAKSAIVPTMVKGEEDLVEANSHLALVSAVAGVSGAAIGGIFLFGGPSLVCAFAAVFYLLTTLAATRLPKYIVASEPAGEAEREELSGRGILLAASAMALLRGIVGFLTFLLAFELRGGKEGVDFHLEGAAVGVATAAARDINVTGSPSAPAWHFGVVAVLAGIGAFAGARAAPSLRKALAEEKILLAVTFAAAAVGVIAMWTGGLFGAAALSLCVALSAAIGKLAFDSLVQRDAPDANYGRSFSRFEARFQMTWVIGAFLAVVSPVRSARFGYFVIAAVATFAAVSYLIGRRTLVDNPDNPDNVDDDGDSTGDTIAIDDSIDARKADAGTPDDLEPRWSQPEIFEVDSTTDTTEPAENGDDSPSTWSTELGTTVSSVDGVEIVELPEPEPERESD